MSSHRWELTLDRYIAKEWARALLTILAYILIASVPTVFVFLMIQASQLFPIFVEASIAVEMLKVIVQVNGFLIGFCGLTFTQLFGAITRTLQGEQLEEKRRFLVSALIVTILFFTVSIFSSLESMAKTPNVTFELFELFRRPFFFLLWGIFFFTFSITIRISPQRFDVAVEV